MKYGYLEQFTQQRRITDPSAWVDGETAGRVGAAADKLGTERLKPIYDRLGSQVDYGQIRIIVACFGIVEAVRIESAML